MRRGWLLVAVVVVGFVGCSAVGQVGTWFHQSVTTPSGGTGTIDWAGGWIQVEGVGVPGPNATSEAQGKQLARDAAIADAQWRLLEIIKGLSVTGATTVLDHMASSAVRTEVEGTIKNFQTIDERWNVPTKTFLFFFKRKGDWREGEYRVTIIYSQDQLLLTFIPELAQIYPSEEEEPETAEPTPYTGLVFDARGYGTDLSPSLFIKLIDTRGDPVADGVAVSYVPSAGYRLNIPDLTVANAMQDPRVGASPLRVTVLGTTQDGFALIISQTDSALIRQMAATSNILTRGEGSVLIVAD